MRKLLVLILVLGISSLVSATPVLTAEKYTIQVNETIEIYITGTAADATVLPDGPGGGFNGTLWTDYYHYNPTDPYGDDPYLLIYPHNYTIENAAGGGAGGINFDPNYAVSFIAAPTFHSTGDPYQEADDVDAGLWFTFEVTGIAVGSTVLEMWDIGFTGVEDSVTITVIPEPMTIALLGLGGLFLRRRK